VQLKLACLLFTAWTQRLAHAKLYAYLSQSCLWSFGIVSLWSGGLCSLGVMVIWGSFTNITATLVMKPQLGALTRPGHFAVVLQHHPWRLWSRPLLPGSVARRPGQALQLRRPGNMDTDRRLADWSRLRGTCRWLFVHLAVVMCFREEQWLKMSFGL
jgi:hypothetical protein